MVVSELKYFLIPSLKIKHYNQECVILICIYGYYLLYSLAIFKL